MTEEEKEEFLEMKREIEALRARVGQLEDIPPMIRYDIPDVSPIVDVPSEWVFPEGPTIYGTAMGTSEQRDYRVGDIPEQEDLRWLIP